METVVEPPGHGMDRSSSEHLPTAPVSSTALPVVVGTPGGVVAGWYGAHI